MIDFETECVLGVPLALVNYQQASEWIVAASLETTAPLAVAAANTMVVTHARHDAAYRAVLTRFAMITPDGMPLVWSLNRKLPPGKKLRDRVYGPTLMLETFAASQGKPGVSHFLMGGTDDTLEKLKVNLKAKFPGTEIAGVYSPPFGEWNDETHTDIIRRIRESRANIIWVGLGCPKQENWIASQLDRLPPGVYPAVGAAFAFHAGKVKQAPNWMQRSGLEWLFRLAAEPRRLFSRYLKYNSLFLCYSLRDGLFGARP